MDPGYETVVELQDLLWTLAAYLLHGTIVFLHAGLACFLLGTGLHDLLLPGLDGKWLRRLGASPVGSPDASPLGAIRITLGPTPRAPTGDFA